MFGYNFAIVLLAATDQYACCLFHGIVGKIDLYEMLDIMNSRN